ncbi:uncharacterized protein PHALS_00679 [Plasmopara halstedii]|uniref:Uncharacterized protein n=1 Tax=Plasmopara halstedii TaxID=4781 RepID=A0A0P1ARS2_PLAHL|nr:uncharacterized protein PHALS_00679 [Plasmopara halstedii]CEG44310.1 hypothetical protein PHALS_00679 [Plasmopara halstedii]|eukprot:XP_024580679.1 hypothetical protein PHALS_00679 [Plasmopara halstedii]
MSFQIVNKHNDNEQCGFESGGRLLDCLFSRTSPRKQDNGPLIENCIYRCKEKFSGGEKIRNGRANSAFNLPTLDVEHMISIKSAPLSYA